MATRKKKASKKAAKKGSKEATAEGEAAHSANGSPAVDRTTVDLPAPELVDVAALKAHPRNYRSHPPDQLEHIRASLREHGFYRNVVITGDGTILAGHGVVEAAKLEGLTQVTAIRLPIAPDSPAALKVLTGDN